MVAPTSRRSCLLVSHSGVCSDKIRLTLSFGVSSAEDNTRSAVRSKHPWKMLCLLYHADADRVVNLVTNFYAPCRVHALP